MREPFEHDPQPESLAGVVHPVSTGNCPDSQFHGSPFRYCQCGWTEPHDCAVDGHDYEHVVSGSGELLKITCGACSSAWRVEPT